MREIQDPHETQAQFDADVAAIAAMDDSAGAQRHGHPGKLAQWITGYVQSTHPEIYREALRADEIARQARRHVIRRAQFLNEDQ